MTDRSVSLAALALRLTLGLFFLQWGVEKFVVPENTPGIWGYFYGVVPPAFAASLFGAVEIAIALCLFLGFARTLAYGAALAIHAITVAVTWRQLLDPWGDPVNHLFVAGVPVLGALAALFLIRRHDALALGGRPAPSAGG